MDIKNKIFYAVGVVATAAVMILPAGAEADSVTYGLNGEISNSGFIPGGDLLVDPWLELTFEDGLGPSTQVKVTMEATNLVGQEFVSDWLFNFNPALNFSDLSVSDKSGDVTFDVELGNPVGTADSYDGNGAHDFDIEVTFAKPSADRFTAGDMVMFNLNYSDDISIADFMFENQVGHGPFYTVAHVQGIAGGGSGWVAPIPEPETYALLGSMLAAGMLIARRKKQRA